MKTFYDIITEHFAAHPDMLPQDYLKLAYQSEFGCGHLITDREYAYGKLLEELDSVKSDTSEPMTEDIGGGYARLNLSAVKGVLPPEVIFAVFENSVVQTGSEEGFRNKLSLIVRTAELGIINADASALKAYFDSYDGKTIPSHSPLYRQKYCPAYRVIRSEYAAVMPVLSLVCETSASPEHINAVIEGVRQCIISE